MKYNLIKEKEKIKTQIIKALEVYRSEKGFYFFDSSIPNANLGLVILDDNDLEVMLITIKKSFKILITTKCLFFIKKSSCTRIEASEIEDFDLMNFVNAEPKENDSRLKLFYKRTQYLRQFGDFRIIKSDGSFIEIYLPNRQFVYGLSSAIKKLQFVTRKYQGI